MGGRAARTLEVLIAEYHGDQRPRERLSHRHTSLVSACGSSSDSSGATVSNEVCLLIALCEKLGVCIVKSYNRNMDLKIGRLP